jgi:hypothetical protein
MKLQNDRLILIFIVASILVSCANHAGSIKKEKPQINPPKNLTPSGIVFIGEMHNFGTLKAGEIVSFSFVFMNSGTIPLAIKKIDTSCGCIRVKFDNKSIKQGEKSAIEVIFNTSGEWGNQLKMINVETSTGERKELRISAFIENEQFNNLLNTKQ